VKVVVALGGNALLERGETPDVDIQEHHIQIAAKALAPLVQEHDVVITHGNGPQVGALALESGADPALSRPYPFDSLVAETQGLIGSWLLAAVEHAAPGHEAVCLLTRTLVDAADPAFSTPTKFVGRLYTARQARELSRQHGWAMRQDGNSWRRVVASPEPTAIIELEEISSLLDAGWTVICAGGGGVPVVRNEEGDLRGVDAVVDKDLTTALLAARLQADALLLLTDVANVERDYGTPSASAIERTTVEALRELDFAAGSMGPKVEGACRFVEATGGMAAIGKLADAVRLLGGEAGTIVYPNRPAAGAAGVSANQSQEVTP
jgi:carbamate kinase